MPWIRLAEMARRLEWQGPGWECGSAEALAAEVAATVQALRALARY